MKNSLFSRAVRKKRTGILRHDAAAHRLFSLPAGNFAVSAALLAGVAMLLLLPQAALADVANGDRLAKQWCANCHVVNGSGPAATLPQGPPSFRVIAGRLNPEQLRAFLTRPHGAMPDLALTRVEIDDLILYFDKQR
jgi:mono/diheme cytochrome c family protein